MYTIASYFSIAEATEWNQKILSVSDKSETFKPCSATYLLKVSSLV